MSRLHPITFLAFIVFTSALASAEPLVKTSALPGAEIPAGTELKIQADYEHQKFASPTALTFDSQGRIYVAQTPRNGFGIEDDREHLYWYLDDLASQKPGDRRALHEKWKDKHPLEKMTDKSELITRFTDTTGDGNYDQHNLFADGFNDLLDGTAAGIFAYEDTIYFSCIPKLLMLRDTDGDGAADQRETIEEGFGIRVSLSGHDMNGFALGPDGRIYGTIGDRGFSLTTKEGVVYDYPNEGAVFRFEPDGSHFEIVHTGLRNPKEIAFNELGYAFTVDNNSDQGDKARVVYIVEGGDSGWEMEHQAMFTFHRQIGLEKMPPSRWMDEKIWHLANPEQPAFIVPPIAHLASGPSGLTYHPGTGFLESEAGRFLLCDYRGSAANSSIWSFATEPEGAGMKMSDARRFLTGVAATDIEYSWDGRLFITDFCGGWEAHDDGRLLSLDVSKDMWRAEDAASTAKIVREGFEQRSSEELAGLLRHPDSRIRLRAQLALTRKPDALKRFTDASASPDFMVRIHGIWGLGIVARHGQVSAEEGLIALTNDENEEIRCQALRALADASFQRPSLPIAALLSDPSPRVRYFAAILAGKRKSIELLEPLCGMIAANENHDPLLRHAGAFALQHLSDDPKVVASLADHSSSAVRLAAVVALRRMKSPMVGDFIADKNDQVSDEAVRAVCDLDLAERRQEVAGLMDSLETRSWSSLMLRRLLHNSFQLGDEQNAGRVLRFTMDTKQPEALRIEASRLLSLWLKPFPVDQFTGHWHPLPEREPATLIPQLNGKIPGMLKQDSVSLTIALNLTAQYGLTVPELDEAALRAIITGADTSTAACSKALDLLTDRAPEDLDAFLDETIRNAPDGIALTALGHLAKRSPQAAIAPLAAALESNRPGLACGSWAILAGIKGAKVDALFMKGLDHLQAANGISPHAIELMEAVKSRKSPPVRAAAAALRKSLSENPDPLAKWNPSIEGGDPVAGQAVFASHPAGECMRCHRVGENHDAGGVTAPNLMGIGARHTDRRFFLESLIAPSAAIAPGFGVVSIDFKNGTHLVGNLIDSQPEHLDVETEGRTLRIRRDDVESLTTPLSPMPAMGDVMKPREIRDVIAWLASMTDTAGVSVPVKIEPEPFDPAILAGTEKPSTALDPALEKTGRVQFIVCGACHGQSGEGTAAGPPLAGSEWVNGPVENLIRIQLRGLHGPIEVKGQTYNFPAGMAPLAYQTDDQVAAVLSYVRASFGNSASPVAPAEVTALRGEVGKPPLVAADLVSPKAAPAAVKPAVSRKYEDLNVESSHTKWIIGALIGLASLILLIKRKS